MALSGGLSGRSPGQGQGGNSFPPRRARRGQPTLTGAARSIRHRPLGNPGCRGKPSTPAISSARRPVLSRRQDQRRGGPGNRLSPRDSHVQVGLGAGKASPSFASSGSGFVYRCLGRGPVPKYGIGSGDSVLGECHHSGSADRRDRPNRCCRTHFRLGGCPYQRIFERDVPEQNEMCGRDTIGGWRPGSRHRVAGLSHLGQGTEGNQECNSIKASIQVNGTSFRSASSTGGRGNSRRGLSGCHRHRG